MKYKEYKPTWKSDVPEKDSYRTLFRWGNPEYINEPSEPFYQFIKEKLELSDEDFLVQSYDGEKGIDCELPCKLAKEHIKEFEDIVGIVDTRTDTLSRVRAAYAKGVVDSMRLRREMLENVPDVVLSPSSEEQLIMILKYCNKHNIPVYIGGGNTNTVRAGECVKGGVKLDLKRNYNKVLSFSEIDQTVTVMSGITGPQLEEVLNNANEYFTNVTGRYTVGHIPYSYEFSTVGGWVSSRGIGQASMRYGGIDDILMSATYLMPRGEIVTANCNRGSGMPSIDELMLGAEGQLGIVLSCTLKVRKYTFATKKCYAYLMKDWGTAVRCAKDYVSKEHGLPSVMRVCDVDSTEVMVRMSRFIHKGPLPSLLERFGIIEGERCMIFGYTEGEKSYSSYIKRNLNRHAMRYGAYMGAGNISKKWDKVRFDSAYIRDVLQDYDIIMDEVACRVSWSMLQEVYPTVKDFFNDRGVLNMIELYDLTPHGCMMSIKYINKFESIDKYESFYKDFIEMLEMTGAELPRSHGIGMYGDTLLEKVPSIYMSVLRVVKKYLDPKNIINPNGYISEYFRKDKNDKD